MDNLILLAFLLGVAGCGGEAPEVATDEAPLVEGANTQGCGKPTYPNPWGFSYHGGPLIQRPLVYNIGWGVIDRGNDLNRAVKTMTEGPYLANVVNQYNSTHITKGTFGGGISWMKNAPHAGQTVTEGQIENMLNDVIRSRHLPNDGQQVFMVWLPDGVAVDAGKMGHSCSNWCGYHGYIGAAPGLIRTFFAVMFEDSAHCSSCGAPWDLDTRTMIASHELAETVTDPIDISVRGPQGWDDWLAPGGEGEVGDICSDQRYVYRGVTVQCLWSVRDHACIHPAD
jgi:hypothetical protein